jgi:adenine deaminase
MAKVVNIIRERQGGLVAYSSEEDVCEVLELPIAGLMSNRDIDYVADKNRKLRAAVTKLGCNLTSPFTTLSFMALITIPHFKISDQGLFDADKLKFIDLIHNF